MSRYHQFFNIKTLEDLCLYYCIINGKDVTSLNHKYLNEKYFGCLNLQNLKKIDELYRKVLHRYFVCEKKFISCNMLMILHDDVYRYRTRYSFKKNDIYLMKLLESFNDKKLKFIFQYFISRFKKLSKKLILFNLKTLF